jgi:hypothetical protein
LLALAFLATDPLLFISARADDDDGGFHDTSESPSGAVVLCRFLATVAVGGVDDAWDEAAALHLVRTGSDRGARVLGAYFDW